MPLLAFEELIYNPVGNFLLDRCGVKYYDPFLLCIHGFTISAN